MENKYYTPEIEDLRVGYECQWNDLSIWRDEILDSYGLFATIINESNESLVSKIRTKYLDKQDIESCLENTNILFIFDNSSKKIKLLKNNTIVFDGICKSKNELKKIVEYIK